MLLLSLAEVKESCYQKSPHTMGSTSLLSSTMQKQKLLSENKLGREGREDEGSILILAIYNVIIS